LAHGVKTRISALDSLNAEALKRGEYELGSAAERMHSSVIVGLRKKLEDAMADFSALRTCVPAQQVLGRDLLHMVVAGNTQHTCCRL
jgi:hypothetical protein